MFPEHSRTGKSHDDFDLFATVALVAMHRALGTGGLFFTKMAAIQSQVDVAL